MALKQVIIVRDDLKLPKGKMAAQVAHAAVQAVMNSDKDKVKEWADEGMAKIVLKAADEKEMLALLQKAKQAGLKTAMITDAGRTVIAPGTKTCVGIGPDEESAIDAVTGHLKMM